MGEIDAHTYGSHQSISVDYDRAESHSTGVFPCPRLPGLLPGLRQCWALWMPVVTVLGAKSPLSYYKCSYSYFELYVYQPAIDTKPRSHQHKPTATAPHFAKFDIWGEEHRMFSCDALAVVISLKSADVSEPADVRRESNFFCESTFV